MSALVEGILIGIAIDVAFNIAWHFAVTVKHIDRRLSDLVHHRHTYDQEYIAATKHANDTHKAAQWYSVGDDPVIRDNVYEN